MSDKPFNLYLQLLSPTIPGARKDFSADIVSLNITLTLNGTEINWTKFYEEYAGDEYWQGPEFYTSVVPGLYIIRVTSPNNLGKYVLVIGKIENFPPIEIIKAYYSLPKLKSEFFNKPFYLAFTSKMGKFLLIPPIIIIVVILVIIFLVKRHNKTTKRKRRRGKS